MSTRILSKTDIRLPSATGISSPHIVISVRRPVVLSETVLPPVLGPVMISALYSSPIEMSTGTAFAGSMRG